MEKIYKDVNDLIKDYFLAAHLEMDNEDKTFLQRYSEASSKEMAKIIKEIIEGISNSDSKISASASERKLH